MQKGFFWQIYWNIFAGKKPEAAHVENSLAHNFIKLSFVVEHLRSLLIN